MSQFREKLQIDGRMVGKTDTPYFLGPFPTRTGVQKIPSQKIGVLVNTRGLVHLIIVVLGL